MVGADEHRDMPARGPCDQGLTDRRPRGGKSVGVGLQGGADLVARGGQMPEQHVLAVRPAPAIEIAVLAGLPAEPAPHYAVLDVELACERGPDAGVPERVRRVQHVAPAPPSPPSPPTLRVHRPVQQVAHERLARRDQLVREHVPGTDLQTPGLHEGADVRFALGADAQVVLDQHRLSVEQKTAVAGVLPQPFDEIVEDGHEPGLEGGRREIPLPVPMRMRDEMKDETGQANDQGPAYVTVSMSRRAPPAKVDYHNQPSPLCHADRSSPSPLRSHSQ